MGIPSTAVPRPLAESLRGTAEEQKVCAPGECRIIQHSPSGSSKRIRSPGLVPPSPSGKVDCGWMTGKPEVMCGRVLCANDVPDLLAARNIPRLTVGHQV